MKGSNRLQNAWKKVPLALIGIIAVFAVMLLLLWSNVTNSWQASPALVPDVYFEGQYKIGDGEWKPIDEKTHISSMQGDVTLKGQFHLVVEGEHVGVAGEGVPLAFYLNHIHITIKEQGLPPHINDIEHDITGKDLCGECCLGYSLQTDAPVELIFHNPHRFGNENAIDEFLQELSVYADANFEKEFAAQGDTARYIGLFFIIIAFVLLGTALFSTLLHLEGVGKLWLIGLCVFFAGGYFIYGAKGVFFWGSSVIGNTTILGICMMLYMLCICTLIASTLKGNLQKISIAAVTFLGLYCSAIAIHCLHSNTRFYDTWLWWAIIQSAVNIILLVCLAFNVKHAIKGKIIGTLGAAVLLLSFETDFIGTALGWWQGGLVCKYIFALLLLISIVLVWQIIPHNINVARKAKEMEAEQKLIRAQLQETRVAIMISQIQPHFIYNVLGTIQQLCKENPESAANLVQNFSIYLRGNFSELDNTAPIRFAKELEHVRCYTEIELLRFPDMTVLYDIQTEGFLLPALTVQPLVENAIKHGLMGRETGGTVSVAAYETPTHYCVKVVDDGVGFDTANLRDEKKHIGIRNVRERLQVMCGGSLTIESQQGIGTTALIQIPKEGKHYDRNCGR